MERRRRLVRLASASAVALVLAGGASACSSGPLAPDPAATVGDTEISRADVIDQVAIDEAFLRAQAEAQADATQLEGQERDDAIDAAVGRFTGEGADTIPMAQASTGLTTLVRLAVLEAALEDVGGEVTDADRSSGRESAVSELQQAGIAEDDVPAAYLEQRAELYALQSAISAAVEVPEEDLRAAYEEQADDYAQICVSVIVVPDEASADDVAARLADGEDFADVAAEVSTDQQTAAQGGAAGCGATADVTPSLGEEVATSEIDEVLAPRAIADGSGYVITTVTSRDVPAYEDIAEQLRQGLSQDSANSALESAVGLVEVDPRFGTWDEATATVVSPDQPATPVVDGSTVPAGS